MSEPELRDEVVDAARKMRAARERKAMAGPDLTQAIVAEQLLYQALDRLAALPSPETTPAGVLDEAAREVVEFRPTARFQHLDPTGPDILEAVAAWMDKVDARDGNANDHVQRDLRLWAEKMRALAAALGRSGSGGGRG